MKKKKREKNGWCWTNLFGKDPLCQGPKRLWYTLSKLNYCLVKVELKA